jgi:hypothetical protein
MLLSHAAQSAWLYLCGKTTFTLYPPAEGALNCDL